MIAEALPPTRCSKFCNMTSQTFTRVIAGATCGTAIPDRSNDMVVHVYVLLSELGYVGGRACPQNEHQQKIYGLYESKEAIEDSRCCIYNLRGFSFIFL